jgi:ubiquinone/menaquinone biosynthesis C-methylase UbiE
MVHMRRRLFIIALALSVFIVVPCRAEEDTYQEEADRLARLLNWHEGSVVAEIGAGRGELTLAAAKCVGTNGRVYTTELDAKALANLEGLAVKNKNITARQATETETNLPVESCDSIFMRFVYHHLTKPTKTDASLFRSLKPGGLLAVIDEEPRSGTLVPDGVPKNRDGHGVPKRILISELTAAGFEIATVCNDWPLHDVIQSYCVVFRKPSR